MRILCALGWNVEQRQWNIWYEGPLEKDVF